MNLDLKQLVETITREVVSKIEQTDKVTAVPISTVKNSSCPPALVVLGVGEEGFDNAFGTVKDMISSGFDGALALSKEAMEKLGEGGIKKINPNIKIVEKDVSREIYDLLRQVSVVVIPVLMSDAFKISSLIGDTFVSKIALQALFAGKKVVASPDGIFLSLSMSSEQTVSSNSRMNSKLRERLDQLRGLGVELVSLKNIREHLGGFFVPLAEGKSHTPCTLTCSWSKEGNCGGCGLCVNGIPENVEAIVDAGAARVGATLGVKDGINSELAVMIDHTLLKADATRDEVRKLCEEARKYKFASVCINPTFVSLAHELLCGSPVKVCTVIGFPLGADTTVTKAMETRDAIANGADEVDMVINVGALKAGDYELVKNDIKAVVNSAGGRIVKVIFETALLNKEQKIKACEFSKEAGADFVKTSTGFGPGGATVEDILLMREQVGKYMGVKASGGVRDYEGAMKMIKAGATRIGASASVSIVEGKKSGKDGY